MWEIGNIEAGLRILEKMEKTSNLRYFKIVLEKMMIQEA